MLTLVYVPSAAACSSLTVDIGRAGQPGWAARKYDVDILQDEKEMRY